MNLVAGDAAACLWEFTHAKRGNCWVRRLALLSGCNLLLHHPPYWQADVSALQQPSQQSIGTEQYRGLLVAPQASAWLAASDQDRVTVYFERVAF